MNMSIWFLVGAILVFFMQCGFAMVETGFTRAKNAGNIIMKNLMDFCIGTVMFFLLGYGLMMGQHSALGLVGRPEWGMFRDFESFDWSSFVFQLVFCATAATIVSGAMAERTKFSAYCLYSAIISLLIYPIEAGWVWGGGWLSRLSFIDFAGSCVIHMVGGLSALVGAAILGPRIGKYTKSQDGSITSNAIPGHSVTLGAVFLFCGLPGTALTARRQPMWKRWHVSSGQLRSPRRWQRSPVCSLPGGRTESRMSPCASTPRWPDWSPSPLAAPAWMRSEQRLLALSRGSS